MYFCVLAVVTAFVTGDRLRARSSRLQHMVSKPRRWCSVTRRSNQGDSMVLIAGRRKKETHPLEPSIWGQAIRSRRQWNTPRIRCRGISCGLRCPRPIIRSGLHMCNAIWKPCFCGERLSQTRLSDVKIDSPWAPC
jgi:hypothetical protein